MSVREGLRPAQTRILAYTDGPLAISAVPGAGKTYILERLVVRLVGELEVNPSQILVLTFMRGAAQTFKLRIAKALAEREMTAYGLSAMTIHAFCLGVVRRFNAATRDDEGGGSDMPVMDENLQLSLLRRALDRYVTTADEATRADLAKRYAKPNDDRHDPRQACCDAARSAISAAKHRRLSADEVDVALASQPELAFLYRAYLADQEALSAVDFDDQVQEAIRLLRTHPELRASYQRRYRYVMEDEAQDSTPAQNELIHLLTDGPDGEPGNLIRVGDANQSITASFTFTDPAYFRAYCESLAPLDRHHVMAEAGRSATPILDVANALVAVTEGHPDPVCRLAFHAVTIQPASTGPANPVATAPPSWTVFGDRNQEMDAVLVAARTFMREHPRATAAVLVYSNNQVGAYADRARTLDMPITSEGSSTLTPKDLLGLLGRALDFLALPADGQMAAFLGMLEAVVAVRGEAFGDPKAILAYLRAGAWPEAWIFPDRGLPAARPAAIAEADYGLALRIASDLNSLIGARHLPPAELLPLIAQTLVDDPAAPLVAARAAGTARQLVARGDQLADPWQALRAAIKELAENSANRRGLVADPGDLRAPEAGRLHITTMHKAKGAEYGAVWLPALGFYFGENSHFPWDLASASIRDMEGFHAKHSLLAYGLGEPPTRATLQLAGRQLEIAERLRLLYVGITRAECELHLSCSQFARQAGNPPAGAHVLALAAGLPTLVAP